jgi:hypothetical protein
VEEILAELPEAGIGERCVEVNTLVERVDWIEVWAADEMVRLARSQAARR